MPECNSFTISVVQPCGTAHSEGLDMVLCNLLIFIFTLNEVLVNSDTNNGIPCNKGERVTERFPGKRECAPCQDGYFQQTPKFSKSCNACAKCDEVTGSFVKVKCTKETDTICGCREGFSPLLENSAWCKCDKGSGLKNGVCSRCEEGFFSTEIDSSCKKWKQCGSTGIKKAGTATSDVICNELNGSQTTTSPTSIKKVFLSLLTTRRPHEGVQTQKTLSSTTTAPVQQNILRHTTQPSFPRSNTSTHIGTAILILGIVGLLLLTAMTCKLHVTPCWRTKPAVQTKDSLCRRPVEESGDGSESSLKLNPEP
ncbi:tumor necrosis factor receptor superfamily member 4 [Girardinichthys multiradiatus]|uniref:tumor necrosis factor receptor superfamily member 4 n=1 Tax=Girardinichthys multiradiatus TaxID=208333 RepID=UPI001FAC88AD|nr:tumor necrosis factor receptor superfamily member 4 [Girardinichthys multiradiatus]